MQRVVLIEKACSPVARGDPVAAAAATRNDLEHPVRVACGVSVLEGMGLIVIIQPIGRDYANPGDYDTQFVGLNGRMSELHATVAAWDGERTASPAAA